MSSHDGLDRFGEEAATRIGGQPASERVMLGSVEKMVEEHDAGARTLVAMGRELVVLHDRTSGSLPLWDARFALERAGQPRVARSRMYCPTPPAREFVDQVLEGRRFWPPLIVFRRESLRTGRGVAVDALDQ